MRRLLKITLALILTLVLLISPSIVKGDIATKEVTVDISATYDGANDNVEFFKDAHPFNSELIINNLNARSDYQFAFWIVDGFVREELTENNTFLVTNDLTALSVYHLNDERAVVFIDHNGKLIDIQYVAINGEATLPVDLPDKHNYITDGFVSIKGSTKIDNITENTVFKLQYSKASEDFYSILVEGGSPSNQVPNYNELVTITPTIANFSHWEENGNIVSYKESYTFSALYDRKLIAISDPLLVKESKINMSHNLAIRTGYNSHLAQIELHAGDILLEYGYLVSKDEGDLTLDNAIIVKSSSIHPVTNEFLTSISSEYTNIKAYAVVKNDMGISELYSEKYVLARKDSEIFYDNVDSWGLTASYQTIPVLGTNNVEWSLVDVRNEGGYSINSNGVTLRGREKVTDPAYNSTITTVFGNGLNSFSFDYRKAFTGGTVRRYKLDISNEVRFETYDLPEFGDAAGEQTDIYSYYIDNLDMQGAVTVRIYAESNGQATFDNFEWTEFEPNYTHAEKINITYDINYNEGLKLKPQRILNNSITIEPQVPIREGYDFLGWYLNGERFDFDTSITEDIILEAQWLEEGASLIVTYISNMDGIDTVTYNAASGEQLASPYYESRSDGLTLTGWYKDIGFTEQWSFEDDLVDEHITLYAKWESIHFMLTSDKTGLSNNTYNDFTVYEEFGTWTGSSNRTTTNGEYTFGTNGSNSIIFNAKEGFYIHSVEISVGSGAGTSRKVTMDGIDIITGVKKETIMVDGNEVVVFKNNKVILPDYYVSIMLDASGALFYDSIKVELRALSKGFVVKDPAAPKLPVFSGTYQKAYYLELGDVWLDPINSEQIVATSVIDDNLVEVYSDLSNPTNFINSGYYPFIYYADDDGNISSITIHVTVIDAPKNKNDSDYYMPYYSGVEAVDDNSEQLEGFLFNLLNETLEQVTYAKAREALEIADRDPNNFDNVYLIYDGDTAPGPWDHPNWEREHVWPNSMLGIERVTNSDANIGSDLHNLRAIRPSVNQSRSNRYFTEPEETLPNGYGLVGTHAYYPGDDHIGDVARILLYVHLVWGLPFENIKDLSIPREDIDMLIRWHLADPVDDFERYRNEVIFSYQGNRNPYIDYPEFVEVIYGTVTTTEGITVSFVITIPVTDLTPIRNRNSFVM